MLTNLGSLLAVRACLIFPVALATHAPLDPPFGIQNNKNSSGLILTSAALNNPLHRPLRLGKVNASLWKMIADTLRQEGIGLAYKAVRSSFLMLFLTLVDADRAAKDLVEANWVALKSVLVHAGVPRLAPTAFAVMSVTLDIIVWADCAELARQYRHLLDECLRIYSNAHDTKKAIVLVENQMQDAKSAVLTESCPWLHYLRGNLVQESKAGAANIEKVKNTITAAHYIRKNGGLAAVAGVVVGGTFCLVVAWASCVPLAVAGLAAGAAGAAGASQGGWLAGDLRRLRDTCTSHVAEIQRMIDQVDMFFIVTMRMACPPPGVNLMDRPPMLGNFAAEPWVCRLGEGMVLALVVNAILLFGLLLATVARCSIYRRSRARLMEVGTAANVAGECSLAETHEFGDGRSGQMALECCSPGG